MDSPEAIISEYVYPLFKATTLEELITRMTYGTLIYGALTIFIPIAAPYGRHSAAWAGFGIPTRVAWIVQESPAFFIPLFLSISGSRKAYSSITNQLCLGMFLMHYFHRTFIFPVLLKSKNPTPFMPFFFAFLTCSYNGILHGLYFVNYYQYDEEWLMRPHFWIGFALFLYGMGSNIGADSILRNLRKVGSNQYKIPYGGMFKYVSCANYLGEIIEMWGYAIASLAPPAIAHAFFTTFFLSKRALDHHRWYLKKFEDYPQDRKAIFPFIF